MPGRAIHAVLAERAGALDPAVPAAMRGADDGGGGWSRGPVALGRAQGDGAPTPAGDDAIVADVRLHDRDALLRELRLGDVSDERIHRPTSGWNITVSSPSGRAGGASLRTNRASAPGIEPLWRRLSGP